MKVRTEARREAILEVASEVFLELGFERASIAEIVRRIGGSKSTIYGYYPSKEALFQAVTLAAGERHIRTAFDELAAHDIRSGIHGVLGSFCNKLVRFLCSPQMLATHRMVLAEAGHSNMGELFYEAGPGRGACELAEFFSAAMENGHLRKADPLVAALQLFSLLNAEIQLRWYYRAPPPLTEQEMQGVAERALATFSRAYGVPLATPDGEMAEPVDTPCTP